MHLNLRTLCVSLLMQSVTSSTTPQRICCVTPEESSEDSHCHLILLEPTEFGSPHPEFTRPTTDFSSCSIDYTTRSKLLIAILSHLVDYFSSSRNCFDEEVMFINSKKILTLVHHPNNGSADWNGCIENLIRENNIWKLVNLLRSLPNLKAHLPYIVYLLENIPDSVLVILDHPAVLECLMSNEKSTKNILKDPLIFEAVKASPGLLKTVCRVQHLIRDVGRLTSLINLTDDTNPEVLNALLLTTRILSNKQC